MPLRRLFVDMNSFFASVEQQEKPELRGKPVAVVPVMARTTCCIAASYEARKYGVRTGTPVWAALQLCPKLRLIEGRHERYVVMHNRIKAAVESCLPVGEVRSVDEMVCPLLGDERKPEVAVGIGKRIKAAIYERAGEWMRCSVGIGPNELLAKMAGDMRKPDGLTVLTDADLPARLYDLPLTDFPGVGPRMERRLKLHGICTTRQLCAAPVKTLSAVWGSRILGEKWYRLLRGEEVAEKPEKRRTLGHSHVLPPELRTDAGAYGVLVRLTHKAAARLRKIGCWAGALSVRVRCEDAPGWGAGCEFPRCEDTPTLLRALAGLWARWPRPGTPKKVGMVLTDLVPGRCATPSLFEDDRAAGELSHAMDSVNREFGASVVYFGTMWGMTAAAPTRVAFNRIPDFDPVVN